MDIIGLTGSQSSDPGLDTAPEFIKGKFYRSAQRIGYQGVMKNRKLLGMRSWIKKLSTTDSSLPLKIREMLSNYT